MNLYIINTETIINNYIKELRNFCEKHSENKLILSDDDYTDLREKTKDLHFDLDELRKRTKIFTKVSEQEKEQIKIIIKSLDKFVNDSKIIIFSILANIGYIYDNNITEFQLVEKILDFTPDIDENGIKGFISEFDIWLSNQNGENIVNLSEKISDILMDIVICNDKIRDIYKLG